MATLSQRNTSRNSLPHRPSEVDRYVDRFLSIVCDTSRRYILELLAMPGEEGTISLPEKRSGDIAKALGLAPATTSEHLRSLASIGLVDSRKDGNVVYYRLCNRTMVKAFQDLLVALDKEYAERLNIQ